MTVAGLPVLTEAFRQRSQAFALRTQSLVVR